MKKILIGSALALALCQSVGFAKTYAEVNGQSITEKDIAPLMRSLPGVAFEQLPEDAKGQIINQAVERKLLIEQAKKDRIQSTKEFRDALASAEEELTLEVWMRKQVEKIKVTDSEISQFYNQNKAKFVQPEMVKASHILVSSESDAKAIIADIKKAGKNAQIKFNEIIREKMQNGSAKDGGNLGYFTKNQMVPEFSNAAFKLAKDTYSTTPVKTQFGYHVIFVEDKKASGTLALNDIKGQIEQNLKIKKFQENLKKEGEALRKKAKVEIFK